MEKTREQSFKALFEELKGYENRGVYTLINGFPASPLQIVEAHMVREDGVYMRDYILNEEGDIKELNFCNIT